MKTLHAPSEATTGSAMRTARRSVLVLIGVLIAGCNPDNSSASHDAAGEPHGEVQVFAAASLTDVFGAIEKDFEEKYPGVDVNLSFAGTQSLRTQVENGAEPQVFAAADEDHMDAMRQKGLVDQPAVFAHNEMVIAVPAANPAKIASLADLPNADRLVIAGSSVPAGRYTEEVFTRARAEYGDDFSDRVMKKVVSRENHIRQTLQKVVLGEADAAVVYATDAAAAGDKVRAIPISKRHNVVASYPIATLSKSPHPELGELFVAFVRSEAGAARLKEFGFRPSSIDGAQAKADRK